MESDEDQPAVESLCAGFDEAMRLTVTLEHTDYDCPTASCAVSAVVDRDDAYALSRRLGVAMAALPEALRGMVEKQVSVPNADFCQVQDCFRTLTDRLLRHGCRHTIVRRYAADGSSCL